MKKIIPAVVVTAAAVAAAITYIKKKLDKQNKVNFIEVEVQPKNPYKKAMEKVSSTAESIVSVSKEILIETVDTVGDIVETFIENPADLSGIVEEVKEGIEEIQEIISDTKNPNDEKTSEEVNDYFKEEDEVEDDVKEESEGVVEQALLINSIVADIINEEEKFINESISQEIEKLIDEVIEVEEPVLEESTEEIVVETNDEEEISVEQEMEEIALQVQQEHIEELLTATMEETPLAPIDLPQDDNETILKIVDEQVGEINLINDIIESLEEDDSVEVAIEDLEEIVETAIHEEPIEIDDSLMTEEQFLDKCIISYPGIKDSKIRLIIKQVGVMLDTVDVSKALNLQHFATFDSVKDKDRYASIAAIEGLHVAHSDKDNELIILNTLDTNRISLCKSILQLAQDLTEYNGSYKGWTVVS